MVFTYLLVCFLIALSISSAAADSIYGCGGFVVASSALIKSRKASNAKLDYSHITVKHTSSSVMPEEDNWCWDQGAVELDVGTEDLEGIVFTQKGYWINIISTHDTKAYIEQPDASRIDLLVERGSQKICVENPGEHQLHFVNSCIFSGSSSVKFNTMNPMPIHLTGKNYLVKGLVHVDLSLLQDSSDLSESITIDILNQANVHVDTVNTRYLSDEIGKTGTAVFEYTLWSDLGEEFIIVPQHSRTATEKRSYFIQDNMMYQFVLMAVKLLFP